MALTAHNEFSVCIVVTCYKQPGLLEEALWSALIQKPPCNLVIVNDGCPYIETDELCMRVRLAHPGRVLYVRQINQGPSSARNAGIELALRAWRNTEAVFFLDGDNRLGPETISKMFRELIATRADWIFADLEVIGHRGIVGLAGEYSVLEHVLGNYVDSGSLVARRVFDAGVRFDASFKLGLVDWEFWLEAARHGFRGSYLPAAGFLYRRRPESLARNALRDWSEIVGHLRRKHRAWINPRTCVRTEHAESPRYALLSSDSEDVHLFTDPDDRGRSIKREEFFIRIAWLGARWRLGRAPAYLVVASQNVLVQLDRQRLMHSVLWHLEVAALRRESAVVLSPVCAEGWEICNIADGSEAGPIALAAIECAMSVPARSSNVEGLRLFGFTDTSQFAAAGELIRALDRMRAIFRSQKPARGLLLNSKDRRTEPASRGIRSLFKTGALFPVATRLRRVGVLVTGQLSESTHSHLGSLCSEAKAAGWSTHLFWIQPRVEDGLAAEGVFDTRMVLSGMPVETNRSDAQNPELLGVLGMMDMIVNHECPEWLVLSGDLKRLGVDTAFSSCESGDMGSTRLILETALQFENAISAYLGSESFALRLHALGVPRTKLPVNFAAYLRTTQ